MIIRNEAAKTVHMCASGDVLEGERFRKGWTVKAHAPNVTIKNCAFLNW